MKPLIQVIGTGTPKRFLSGAVMLKVPDCPYGLDGKFIFSDVAVIPEPNEDQLTDIVLFTYKTAKAFYDGEPRIAMLSYSTKGSADSEKIEIIRRVVEKVKKSNTKIKVDGELQFDAAVIPEVAKSKGGNSEVAGQANVLVFPNLDSSNICLKAINRLAKTKYYGTIIQGAPIPFNDLSRGSPPVEIVKLSFLTLMQLQGKKN
jgi:phosphate acetyltransferase